MPLPGPQSVPTLFPSPFPLVFTSFPMLSTPPISLHCPLDAPSNLPPNPPWVSPVSLSLLNQLPRASSEAIELLTPWTPAQSPSPSVQSLASQL